MATAKLDIGRELAAVNRRDHDFYKNLTDEEKKVFSPYILRLALIALSLFELFLN
jgi:hypothetical protein